MTLIVKQCEFFYFVSYYAHPFGYHAYLGLLEAHNFVPKRANMMLAFCMFCTNINEENCKITIKIEIHDIHTIRATETLNNLFLRKKEIDCQSLKLCICKSVFEIFRMKLA